MHDCYRSFQAVVIIYNYEIILVNHSRFPILVGFGMHKTKYSDAIYKMTMHSYVPVKKGSKTHSFQEYYLLNF